MLVLVNNFPSGKRPFAIVALEAVVITGFEQWMKFGFNALRVGNALGIGTVNDAPNFFGNSYLEFLDHLAVADDIDGGLRRQNSDLIHLFGSQFFSFNLDKSFVLQLFAFEVDAQSDYAGMTIQAQHPQKSQSPVRPDVVNDRAVLDSVNFEKFV